MDVDVIEMYGKIQLGGVLGGVYIQNSENVGRMSLEYMIEFTQKTRTIMELQWGICQELKFPVKLDRKLSICNMETIDKFWTDVRRNIDNMLYLKLYVNNL